MRAVLRLAACLRLFGMAAALVAAARPCTAQPRPLSDASAADLLAGKETFDAQCALCHGAGGSGGTGPDLRRPRLLHASSDQELIAVIRNGVPGTPMPFTFLSLSDPMIWQTAAYVRSLSRVAREPIKGSSQNGRTLYQAYGCPSCHTVGGNGGVVGPDLSVIGVQRGTISLRQSLVDPGAEHLADYGVVHITLKDGGEIRGIRLDEDVFWIHLRAATGQIQTFSKATIAQIEREPKGTLMPSFQGLRETELDDLVAYLATLGGDR